MILGAAFDRVFVETVGVGQSEVEAAELVDTLVYVANPGTGDWLQFMKAGVLEAPDIFVVNKSDLGAPARATAAELEGGIGLGEAPDTRWKRPVILVSTRETYGMAELVLALDAHRQALDAAGALPGRRRRSGESWILDGLERRYGSYGLERCGGREALRAQAGRGARGLALRASRAARSRDRGRPAQAGLASGPMPPESDPLFDAVRAACSPAAWSRGVELVRADAVLAEPGKAGEITLRVATRAGLVSHLVTLREASAEWDCDCAGRDDACEHAAAAVIALRRARQQGQPLRGERGAGGSATGSRARRPASRWSAWW